MSRIIITVDNPNSVHWGNYCFSKGPFFISPSSITVPHQNLLIEIDVIRKWVMKPNKSHILSFKRNLFQSSMNPTRIYLLNWLFLIHQSPHSWVLIRFPLMIPYCFTFRPSEWRGHERIAFYFWNKIVTNTIQNTNHPDEWKQQTDRTAIKCFTKNSWDSWQFQNVTE